MSEVVFTATCGFANVYPIGSPIAGPLEVFGIDKGFKEIEGVSIDFLPVSGDPSGHLCQQMRGKIRDADPGRQEKPGVVGQQMEIISPCFAIPSNVAVPASYVPRGRRPRKTGNGSFLGKSYVFEVRPNRLGVAQVMELGDEAVVELFKLSTPYLAQHDRVELFEVGFDRGLVNFDPFGSIAGDVPASRAPSFWRQLYKAMLLKM
jgi:hypothetical protein